MTQSLLQKQSPAAGCLPFRLWQYTRERFPVPAYSLMTALFVVAGISLSSVLRLGWVSLQPLEFIVGFQVIFGLFFQLRVADEWKDRKEDALYQSERPVPRGLISLKELTLAAALVAAGQAALVTIFEPSMLTLLAIIWGYFFMMSREFFCPGYLRSRPILYVLTHMFILVLSDLFITALDWWHAGIKSRAAAFFINSPGHLSHLAPAALILFLAAGFANGLVIELGRKICNADEERPGVETYSKLFGLTPALYLLLACLIAAHCLIACALFQLQAGYVACAVLALMDMLLVMLACISTRSKMQKPLTNIANLSVLLSYLVVFVSALASQNIL
jgi:4-hydroxybenzoate polyprenyltransferase